MNAILRNTGGPRVFPVRFPWFLGVLRSSVEIRRGLEDLRRSRKFRWFSWIPGGPRRFQESQWFQKSLGVTRVSEAARIQGVSGIQGVPQGTRGLGPIFGPFPLFVNFASFFINSKALLFSSFHDVSRISQLT